jgi:hypothetical protein
MKKEKLIAVEIKKVLFFLNRKQAEEIIAELVKKLERLG